MKFESCCVSGILEREKREGERLVVWTADKGTGLIQEGGSKI